MNMQESYESYFRTKHYDERYPGPNQLTLARVKHMLTPGSTVIDIGAGNGRYAIPLAQCGHNIIAVERSDHARRQLESSSLALGLSAKVNCYRDLADIDDEAISVCELGLLLFGVLGHMRFDERAATLLRLRTTLKNPAQIIGSVPNRLIRFRAEQASSRVEDYGPAPRLTYRRHFGGHENVFEYTAFTPSELYAELALHGWTCSRISAESLLSESTVTRQYTIGRVDSFICRYLPPELGYGLLFYAGGASVASPSIGSYPTTVGYS